MMNKLDNKICPYTIVPMALKDKHTVIEFLKNYFFRHEPLVVCLRFFEDTKSLEKLYDHAFKTLDKGLTFKAVSLHGDLMGVILNEIQSKDSNGQEQNNCCNDEDCETNNKYNEFMTLFKKVERESNVFGKYPEINRIMDIKIVAVNESFRGKGVCKALFDKTKQLALHNECSMIRVDCSNYYSAKAAETLQFQCIYHLSYHEYKNKNGEVIFNPSAPHELFKVYVLFIKN